MSERWDVEVDYEAQVARRVEGLAPEHPCGRLHGNTFRITVRLSGPTLQPVGWLRDFGEVDAAMAPVLAAIDHADLNAVPGLGNPTSERLARWIFDALAPSLPELASVSVAETRRTRCNYTRRPA